MPAPAKPSALSSAVRLRHRKGVLAKAKGGDIGSIKQLESFAKDTLLEHDAKALIEAFLHHTSTDIHGSFRESSSRVPSDSAVSALRSLNVLFMHPPFKQDRMLLDWFFSSIQVSDEVWNCLHRWICLTLSTAILSLAEHSEVIDDVDRLAANLADRPPPAIRTKLRKCEDVLYAFTRLWLTDMDTQRPKITISIPILLTNVFSVSQFITATGCSHSELSSIVLQRLRLSHLAFAAYSPPLISAKRELGSVVHQLDLLISSGEAHNSSHILAHLFSSGAISQFLVILNDVLSKCEGQLSGHSMLSHYPLVSLIITTLTSAICASLMFGPMYIRQALDSGFLDLIVRTRVLWQIKTADSDARNAIGTTLSNGLDVIRQHLYHRRVYNRMRKLERAWLNRVPPRGMEHLPYFKSLDRLIQSLDRARRTRSLFKVHGDKGLCENQTCPNARQETVVHLKECAQCGLIVFCSRACQRAQWGVHRTNCDYLASLPLPKRMATSVNILSADVVYYYRCAMWAMVIEGGSKVSAIYERYRSSLQPIPPSAHNSGSPTHVMRIIYAVSPLEFRIEDIAGLRAPGTLHGDLLESTLRFLESSRGVPNVFAVCATFHVGSSEHTIVGPSRQVKY